MVKSDCRSGTSPSPVSMEKMHGGAGNNGAADGHGGGGGGIYSVERLLAAVLLTTSGPGALSQWLALAAAVYFLAGLLGFAWRVRWLLILGVRVARGMPGPRARRRALATFAARPATVPPQGQLPDVIIAATMRSGGTWASHIAHQIRMRGAPPEFFWQEDVVPWVDLHQPCLPRLFRTTATWCDLVEAGILRGGTTPGPPPGPTDCKIVYVFRDLCDVCYSLFFYFPALFQVDSVLIHLEDFVYCARLLLVERALWSLVHFWRRRHDPAILFLFFDELFRDDPSATTANGGGGAACGNGNGSSTSTSSGGGGGSGVGGGLGMGGGGPSGVSSNALRRIAEFVGGGQIPITEELLQTVAAQTTHATMASDENWDRFSGLSVAVLVSERLGVGYRYDLEPYLGKVSRIGGKPGQGRRVLGEALRELFDSKWRLIVTRELGFETLEEMQQARACEVEAMERERRSGEKAAAAAASSERSKSRK